MRKFVMIIIVGCFLFSCHASKKTAKESEEDITAVEYTQVDMGGLTYVFRQSSAQAECDFHTMSDGELITFLEMNHAGDRDDKLPRNIASLPTGLSKKKSATHNKKLRTKICYSNEGEVVAFRHDAVSFLKKTQEALLAISYEQNSEESCVECKTESFYFGW